MGSGAVEAVHVVGDMNAPPDSEPLRDDRKLSVELGSHAAVAIGRRDDAQPSFFTRQAQAEIGYPGGGWKRIAQGRDSDPHRRPADQSAVEPGDGVGIEAFQPHVAGRERRKASHAEGAVEADAFIADAVPKCIFGGAKRIFIRALSGGRSGPRKHHRYCSQAEQSSWRCSH